MVIVRSPEMARRQTRCRWLRKPAGPQSAPPATSAVAQPSRTHRRSQVLPRRDHRNTPPVERREDTRVHAGTEEGEDGADDRPQQQQHAKGDCQRRQACPSTPSMIDVQTSRPPRRRAPARAIRARHRSAHGSVSANAVGESCAARKGLVRAALLENRRMHHPAPAHHEPQERRRGDQRDKANRHSREHELRRRSFR